MASTSPSPNSSPTAVSPAANTPPPLRSSPPPKPPTTPSSQPNANSPNGTSLSLSPPPQSPPSTDGRSPPPVPVSLSPPPPSAPIPSRPPSAALPSSPLLRQPPPSNVPPPSSNVPPPSSNLTRSAPPSPSPDPATGPRPRTSINPPQSSPRTPSTTPPISLSPPPLSNQPPSSPPPASPLSNPPANSHPLPPVPPENSPPPPPARPPRNSPSPPSSDPPRNSPTPPTSAPPSPARPPRNSPAPPSSDPPRNSPTPPTSAPPPPARPPRNSPAPPSSDPPRNSPPPPTSAPPQISPSPLAPQPPHSPPSPPASNPPENFSPPPASTPPNSSPPRPILTPPGTRQATPPPSSPPRLLPPTPVVRLSPPSSFPPPSQVPSGNPTTNNAEANATESSNSSGNGGISTGGTVAIALVLGLLLLSIVGTAICCIWKRKKRTSGLNGVYIMPTPTVSSPKSDSALLKVQTSTFHVGSGSGNVVYSPTEPGGLGNSRSWFTYQELVEATNGFSTQNLLGEGGFGSVYKGCLADGREVAVKQLKIGGGQGEREFRAEVEIISRVHHRYLVSLVGYCISENRRLLVYDYVPNNTLYFHLHGKGRPVMDWATRVKIAVGAARGIAYLHEDCHPRIIHRDIKSSNILLDNNFEARVSDFGLAKLALDANTHVTTRVMGTFGYMAPEYASSGKLTEKSDVFSFGVVLLELITGRKPVDSSQPLGEESLVEWARPLLGHALDSEEFEGLADPRLERNYIDSEMFRMIEAAAACVRHSSTKRPRMGQIVRAFDSMAMSDLTNGMRLGESEIYNSAQQSAEIRLFRRMAFGGSQDHSTDFFSQNSWND